jgi:hypothetical protein
MWTLPPLMLSVMPETLISMPSVIVSACMEMGAKAIAKISVMMQIFFISYIIRCKDKSFPSFAQAFPVKKS